MLDSKQSKNLKLTWIYKTHIWSTLLTKTNNVFKTSSIQMTIACSMDTDGDHFMHEEYCHFDENHKRVKAFATLTASVTLCCESKSFSRQWSASTRTATMLLNSGVSLTTRTEKWILQNKNFFYVVGWRTSQRLTSVAFR